MKHYCWVTTETALRAIRATYLDLDRWQARGREVELPQPGSRLAADDAVYQWHSISEVARVSLLSGGEHLRLARTAIEARQVYPSAHFTVLRGALIGACQAVWILASDDAAERQERGLMVIDAQLEQLRKYYDELATTPLSEDERLELAEQVKWCEGRRREVTGVRRTKSRVNQTEVITWALNHRFHDDDRRGAGRLLWRQMSADAHILVWAVAQRGTVLSSDRRSGIGVLQSGGDLSQIAEPFVAVHLLLAEGWSLFDRLCDSSS